MCYTSKLDSKKNSRDGELRAFAVDAPAQQGRAVVVVDEKERNYDVSTLQVSSTMTGASKAIFSRSGGQKAPFLILIGTLASTPLVSAQARSVERASSGCISVHAQGKPLKELLLDLSQVIDFDMLLVDRAVEDRPVTVALDDEPIEDAIWAILEAAKVSGIVWGAKGKPFRLFAGSSSNDTSTRRQVRSLLDEPSDSETGKGTGHRTTAPEAAPSPSPPRPAVPTVPAPRTPRRASGDARLRGTPDASELSRLAAILGSGLMVGVGFVRRGSHLER